MENWVLISPLSPQLLLANIPSGIYHHIYKELNINSLLHQLSGYTNSARVRHFKPVNFSCHPWRLDLFGTASAAIPWTRPSFPSRSRCSYLLSCIRSRLETWPCRRSADNFLHCLSLPRAYITAAYYICIYEAKTGCLCPPRLNVSGSLLWRKLLIQFVFRNRYTRVYVCIRS